MNLSKSASDVIGDEIKRLEDMVDAMESGPKPGTQGLIATLYEGDVAGKRTVQMDNYGKIIGTPVEEKNTVLDSLNNLTSNNYLVFRSQIDDLGKRMGDLRSMPNSDGAWARVIAGQSEYQVTLTKLCRSGQITVSATSMAVLQLPIRTVTVN